MSIDPSHPGPPGFDPFSAPPTERDEALIPQPSSAWPTVLGVISIVWAAIGILGSACQIAFLPFMGRFVEAFMPPEQADQLVVFTEMTSWLIFAAVLWMAAETYLLVGGVMLLRRRPYSAGHLRVWAVLAIIVWLVNTVGTLWLTPETESTSDSATAQAEQMWEFIGLACGGVLSCAWPVFILIWFGREKIKAEVAQWTSRPDGA